MPTPFDRMLHGSVGDVDITVPAGRGNLGLPNVGQPGGALAASGLSVDERAYQNGEFIMMGISNNVPGGVTVGAGLAVTLQRAPSTPFRPLQATIASTLCPGLFVTLIRCGAIYLIDGDPIAAETLSEVSFANKLSWPTVQTSQNIEVGLLNVTAADITHVSVNVLGWRIRG